ncbi:MAG TPA: hypothetical protein VGF26_27550, partial [Ramlibacter sp.]
WHMDSRPLTHQKRRALLQFEAAYEEWRQATDAWLAAELVLWTRALAGARSPEVARLGADAERLRDSARTAYIRVMDALVHAPTD